MSGRSKDERSKAGGNAAAPDLDEIAARYLDLWQDQMSALAADPEFAEAWRKLVESLGAQTAAWQAQGPTPGLPPGFPMAGGLPDPVAALQAMMMGGARPAATAGGKDEGRHDDGSRARSSTDGGTKTEARAAAAAAASRGGGDDLEQLAARLDRLEKRIAALEAKPAGKGGGARKRNRKPRS